MFRVAGHFPVFNEEIICKSKQRILFSKLFNQPSELLTRDQAAKYLGITPRTLAVWACVKRYNLPYVKIGRLVKYQRTDLDAFITSRTVMQHSGEVGV